MRSRIQNPSASPTVVIPVGSYVLKSDLEAEYGKVAGLVSFTVSGMDCGSTEAGQSALNRLFRLITAFDGLAGLTCRQQPELQYVFFAGSALEMDNWALQDYSLHLDRLPAASQHAALILFGGYPITGTPPSPSSLCGYGSAPYIQCIADYGGSEATSLDVLMAAIITAARAMECYGGTLEIGQINGGVTLAHLAEFTDDVGDGGIGWTLSQSY